MDRRDRQGRPIDEDKWMDLWSDDAYRIMHRSRIRRYYIGTLWIGFDMNRFPWDDYSPLIFETGVFYVDRGGKTRWSCLGTWRWRTEAEATRGHYDVCRTLRSGWRPNIRTGWRGL